MFAAYFEYFDSIKSQDRPDYDYLVDLFASQLTYDELADEDLGILYLNNKHKDELKGAYPKENSSENHSDAMDGIKNIVPSDHLSGHRNTYNTKK